MAIANRIGAQFFSLPFFPSYGNFVRSEFSKAKILDHKFMKIA